jgi:hypothetical protein
VLKETRYATDPDRLFPPPRPAPLTRPQETPPPWSVLPETARLHVLLTLRRVLRQQLTPPPPAQEVPHEPVQQ